MFCNVSTAFKFLNYFYIYLFSLGFHIFMEFIFPCPLIKSHQALEWDAQETGRETVPGGV